MPARVHATLVTDRRELAPGVIVIGFDAPELVRDARPGQFLMAIPPSGERCATALGIYEAEGKRASILFFVTGKRTMELGELRRGDRLDVLGPLGNGFDLSGNPHDVAIVAGGVGIASVLLPAQRLARRGARVRLFYGARTARLLVDIDRFKHAGCEVHTSTDDGTAGHQGFITDLLLRSVRTLPDVILACGPTPMLRAVGRVSAALGVRAQLLLEETFACGVGGCWGCVVPIARTSEQAPGFPDAGDGDAVNARICKEGPVFWADELRW